MTVVRPPLGVRRSGPPPRGVVVAFLTVAVLGMTTGFLVGGAAHGAAAAGAGPADPLPGTLSVHPEVATSIAEVGTTPSVSVVGRPISLVWQALDPGGARVPGFAVACELTVALTSNGSSERAWVNASSGGSLGRSANGTFSVPSVDWNLGVLNLTVSPATAVAVTVRLSGPLLPSVPPPVAVTVEPDLDHLVLYGPIYATPASPSPADARTNATFYHVRDRFFDPTPGAFLILEYSNATLTTTTFVPVTWAVDGATGAWVNYTAAGTGNASVRLTDEANDTLLGPIEIPAVASPAAPAAASLSPFALLAVAVLAVAAVVAILSLIYGGRSRPEVVPASDEEELRRLAEGRATIVELVRRSGSVGLAEIEAAWEPGPPPPVLADWLASLVTDGTLTAALGEGGRARFSLAEHPVEEPKVTFDERALDREIARREAAVDDAAEGGGPK